MKRTAAVVVLTLLSLTGCSSDEPSQRDELIEALKQSDTANLNDATAACMADELTATLSEEQVQAFIDAKPASMKPYTDARTKCTED